MYMQGGQGGGGYGGGGGGMSPYPGGPGNSYPGGGPGGGYQGQGGGPPGGPSGYPGGGPGHYVGGGYPQHQGGGQHPGGGHPGGGAGGPGQGHGMQHPSSYNQYSGHSGGPMGSQMGGQMGSQMGGMGGYGGGGGGGGNGNQMPGGGYGGQHMGGQMGPIVPHTGQMGGYKGGQMGPPGNQPGHYGGPQDGGHGGPSGPGPQWSGGPGSPGSYHQGSANGYGNQGGKGYGGEKGGKDNAGKGGKGGKGGGRGRGGKGQEQYGGGGDRNNYGGHQEQNQYDSQFSSLNLGMGGAMGQLGAGKGKHSNGNPPGTALVPHQHKGGKAGNAGNAGAMYGQGYGGGGGGGGGYEYGAGKGRGKQQVPHSNLFIGNLPEDATEAMLREAFLAHGTIQSCRVFTRNGRTCALLKMGSVAEAERAVKGSASGDVKSRWLVKYADADVGGAADKGGGKDGGFGQLYKGNFSKGGGNFSGGGAAPGGFGWNSSGKGSGSGQPRRREREQTDATPSDNLYVKGLPPRITEAQLHRTFSKVGKVVELKILRYGDSLECAALVRMANIEASKACIEQLNGKAPEGAVPPLTIRFHGKDPATTSDNLYVKGLPLNFTQDMLNLLFGQCGTMRRSRILAPRREMPDDVTLDSAALVQMSSPEEAAAAIQMLNGRVPEGVGPQMVIRYAEQKAGATGGASSTWTEPTPTDNLYVKGLPLGTPDFLLRAVFAQFGTVVRLKVLEPRGGEALDCAALVQMASIDESKASCAALHGRVLAAPLPPMRVRFAGKDQQPGSNLYVAGLPVTIHEQQLRATFAQSGTVVRLRLLVQCGRPETHALVQMASFEEAEKAITTLHGTPPESLGPTLVVRYATKRARDRDRAPGDAAPAVDDEAAAAAIEDGDADAGEAEKKLADAEFDEMAAAAEGGAEDLEDDAAPIESSDAAPLSAPLEALKSLTAESVAEAGMEPMEPYLPAEGDDDDASFDEAP